jgi:hypothetical protein
VKKAASTAGRTPDNNLEPSAKNQATLRVNDMDLKTFFARSAPIVIASFMDGSYFLVVIENHQFGTLRCRWVGAVHCIKRFDWPVD